MSLTLLFPLGLAALAALIVPLVIHLIRRPQHEVIDFAALRWVGERLRPRRRLQFDDPWLLVVRLLLLAAIAFLLAAPVLDRDWRGAREWVVVAPGIDAEQARASATSVSADAEWRWLSAGFPSVASPPGDAQVDTASLLRELDASIDARDRLMVMVPAQLDGLDGERLALSRDVEWKVVEVPPVDVPSPVTALVPIHVAVRHTAEATAPLRYLRATIAAWNAPIADRHVADVQLTDAALADGTDWLIWLGGASPPAINAWVAAGGRVLLPATEAPVDAIPLWRDSQGENIAVAQREGKGLRVSLLRAFDPQSFAQILDADFPERMRELLNDPLPAPARAEASTMSPLAEPARAVAPVFALDDLVIVLIVVLSLSERVLATRRRLRA